MWCACLYLVDRQYGGPEEGGWYYDTGEPRPDDDHELSARFFMSKLEAEQWAFSDEARAGVARLNEGRVAISSVNSEGIYYMRLSFGMPKAWPEERPHYE